LLPLPFSIQLLLAGWISGFRGRRPTIEPRASWWVCIAVALYPPYDYEAHRASQPRFDLRNYVD
jgi:hypothetical protein